MSSLTSNADSQALSATNFDLPSLYLLRPEINVALADAETHLSEFNDDEEQAPLLLDSIDVLKQLAAVLELISLMGGSDLAELLTASMQFLYDAGDNNNDDLILNISEGIMTLNRYIEFVLLKETLEPSLLIPALNRLNGSIGRETFDESSFTNQNHANISIANPEKNYRSLKSLALDETILSTAYRAGLNVVLTKKDDMLNREDRQKLQAMYQACRLAAQHSDTLFWRAAQAVTKDIDEVLPLSNMQKRTLIFLEQQFHNYLPANDSRFADLVSFACLRKNDLAESIKQEFAVNRLDDKQLEQMRRYLFGPNRDVTNKLNQLIQDEISTIKDKVDAFVRMDSNNPSKSDAVEIAEKLNTLASVLKLLNLDKASKALRASANDVKSWKTPTPDDFDHLLSSLMVAENAAILLAKTHTPGAIIQPSHNSQISIYQLDTAYETLISESRRMIAMVEQAVNDYINDADRDVLNLSNTPAMLRQVVGAISFLGLNDCAKVLKRLARYIDEDIIGHTSTISNDILTNIADVIMAVDYHLEGLEHNHPVGNHAMLVGHNSLNKLLVAA